MVNELKGVFNGLNHARCHIAETGVHVSQLVAPV